MVFPLSVHLCLVIFIIGCEGGPYFADEKKPSFPPGHVIEWMKRISDEASLETVSIPGTYQSMKMNTVDQHQAWKFTTQFDAGVRFFDIQISSISRSCAIADGSLKTRKFADVMTEMKSLLVKHSSEVILLRVTPEKCHDEVEKFIKSNEGSVWVSANTPKMKEVRGKIVFVQSLGKKKFTMGLLPLTQSYTSGSTQNYIESIKKHLNKDNAQKYLILTETSAPKSVKTNAKDLNSRLHEYVNSLLNKNEAKPKSLGVIAMDYPGFTLIQTIIQFNSKSGDSSGETGETAAPAEASDTTEDGGE